MTFSDIFKSSFLENVTSVSLLDMVLALVLAFGIGLFIFFVYKKTYGISGRGNTWSLSGMEPLRLLRPSTANSIAVDRKSVV